MYEIRYKWKSFVNSKVLLENRNVKCLDVSSLNIKFFPSYLHNTTIVTVAFNSSEGCPVLSSRALTVGF